MTTPERSVEEIVEGLDEALDTYITILVENRDDGDVLDANLKSWHKTLTQTLQTERKRCEEFVPMPIEKLTVNSDRLMVSALAPSEDFELYYRLTQPNN